MAKPGRYVPGLLGEDFDSSAIMDELYNIRNVLDGIFDGRREVLHAEPSKPEEGTVVYADGTDWNPGAGEGPYYYDGANWKAMFNADVWTTANSISTVTGTPTGSVSDTQTLHDGNVYSVVEVSGGMAVQLTFTGVTEFYGVASNAYYDGGASHLMYLQIYNDDTTTWESFFRMVSSTEYNYRYIELDIDSPYINGSNVVLIRFFHDTPATPGHDLYVDYVGLVSHG